MSRIYGPNTVVELVGKVRTFNTGRRYTSEGQRIVWAIFRSEYGHAVAFLDLDRMLDGVIEVQFGNLDLIDDRWVLRAYDDHHYSHIGYTFETALRAAAKKEGELQQRVVCSWCGVVMQEGASQLTSHGICPKCQKEMMK